MCSKQNRRFTGIKMTQKLKKKIYHMNLNVNLMKKKRNSDQW